MPAFPLPQPNTLAARALVAGTTLAGFSLVLFAALAARAHLHNIYSCNTLADQVGAVDLAAQELLSSITDAETGQRGYMLTGEAAYLEPYDAGRARLGASFRRIEAAPLATAERTARIRRIRDLSAAKMAEIDETVALSRNGETEAALAVVRTNQGKRTMDAIRADVAALQASNNAVLQGARADVFTPRAWGPVGGAAALAVLSLGAAIWITARMQREVSARFQRLQRFTRAFGLTPGTLRGLDGRIVFWGVGAQRLYGYAPAEAMGRIGRDLLQTRFPRPLAEIEAALLRDGAWQGEVTCRHRDGRPLRLLSHWALSRGSAGEPDVAIEVGNDITGIKLAEDERQKATALLRAIVEAAPGLIYAKDRDGRMLLANQSVLDLIGMPWQSVEGKTDQEFLDDPKQAEAVVANDRRVMEQGQTVEFEEEVGAADGRKRVWSSTKAPLRDHDGKVIGLVGISVEITKRKQVEDRLRLMVNELNHRVKNTLATVQAIAAQTLRGRDAQVRSALDDRLLALSSAHDVLTREGWEAASLEDVVAGALAPFGGWRSEHFRVSGPVLRLVSRAALALAMGLHELATNALKYGALSSRSGWVEIDWTVTPGCPALLRLTWIERGGPPVAAPAARGFGIRLIERSLAQDLGGTATVRFDDPLGVRAVVEAPLHEVVPRAGRVSYLPVGAGPQEQSWPC